VNPRGKPNPEDLSALSRRGLLSEVDELELARELANDPELWTSHSVGVDLDNSTAVRAGDDALVARVADAALARVAASRVPKAPRRRPRRVAVLLAAALVLGSGVSAAVLGVVPVPLLGGEKTEQPATLPPAPASKLAPVWRKAARPERPERTAAVADEPPREPNTSDAPRARAARPAAETSAADLFRTANAARHAADFSRAQRLYSELIARYPSSDEARIARVSLGKLLLAKGDPSAAEQEFQNYLKDGKGQLAEEALVSRAQSLQKLGRKDAERATWQRLLADYPNSVYAAEARARLRVLRRE
jgi:TolA-binding protein